jgi:hypothetical protein
MMNLPMVIWCIPAVENLSAPFSAIQYGSVMIA